MFTQKKFLSLPIERQHKKCAEFLRVLYEKKDFEGHWCTYLEFLEWMKEPSFEKLPTLKVISDRYHYHLKLAKQFKKEHHLLPHICRGDRSEGEEPWPIAIYLDHLRSAHNVGSIIRTTEALRLGTLYFSHDTPSISNKQVQDTAMSTDKWVKCERIGDIGKLPRPFIALETGQDALSIHEFIFPASFTLILGNEEYGCSDAMLTQADYIIKIPLRGRKNSLNVSNAFALVAGEICRQKKDSSPL